MVTSFGVWFLVLVVTVIAAPYALRVPPRSRHQWLYVTIVIAFVAWLFLPLMHPVRSF